MKPDIKTIILQVGKEHKLWLGEDIYRISKELCNILHRDIEWQVHYIQVLLANEISQYKEKKVITVDKYVKMLQEMY